MPVTCNAACVQGKHSCKREGEIRICANNQAWVWVRVRVCVCVIIKQISSTQLLVCVCLCVCVGVCVWAFLGVF